MKKVNSKVVYILVASVLLTVGADAGIKGQIIKHSLKKGVTKRVGVHFVSRAKVKSSLQTSIGNLARARDLKSQQRVKSLMGRFAR